MAISPSISRREFEVLTALADQGKTLFSVEDARQASGLRSPYLNALLQRLADKRVLQRVERGLYYVIPIEAGSRRLFSEDAFEVGCALAEPSAVAYWSAVSHHGLTEQIPDVVFLATTASRFDPAPVAMGVRYRFVRVVPWKFFGVVPLEPGRDRGQVTDLEKTVLDALDHPEYSGGIVESAKAVQSGWAGLSPAKVLEYGERMRNSAVFKRLGYLLEHFGLSDEAYLCELRGRIRRGLSKLEPMNPMQGPCCTRWGLRINMDTGDLGRWKES